MSPRQRVMPLCQCDVGVRHRLSEHPGTSQPAHEPLVEGQPQGCETRIRVLQAACDDYRAENARLDQQIVDRDTTIMLQGEDVERLRADLNRANAENERLRNGLRHIEQVADSGTIGSSVICDWWYADEAARLLSDKAQQP